MSESKPQPSLLETTRLSTALQGYYQANPDAQAMRALHEAMYGKQESYEVEDPIGILTALRNSMNPETDPKVIERIDEMLTKVRHAALTDDKVPASSVDRQVSHVVKDPIINAQLQVGFPEPSSVETVHLSSAWLERFTHYNTQAIPAPSDVNVVPPVEVRDRSAVNVSMDKTINAQLLQSFPALSSIVKKLDEMKGDEQPTQKTLSVSTRKP